MQTAVLFKSRERFYSFKKKLSAYGVDCIVLDFSNNEWIEFDYSKIDFVIYFPSFKYSSNFPLALQEVYDNLTHIKSMYPNVRMFPDPGTLQFYNDKYRQFLFLKHKNYPIPDTQPLFSMESVDIADKKFGYPMVIKNRYGAGGGSVFKIDSKKELISFYKMSKFDFFNISSLKYFTKILRKRIFYYFLIKEKRMQYPFFSPPLLAQKYVTIDRDLKTVIGKFKVVEAHWRHQAYKEQWKVNIDDGGVGVWEKVPNEAIDLSVKLAKDLNASWLNIDLITENGKFLITEFSPVWHHYAYKEKPSFVYTDDYNIEVPLDISLDLERIIVESLID